MSHNIHIIRGEQSREAIHDRRLVRSAITFLSGIAIGATTVAAGIAEASFSVDFVSDEFIRAGYTIGGALTLGGFVSAVAIDRLENRLNNSTR